MLCHNLHSPIHFTTIFLCQFPDDEDDDQFQGSIMFATESSEAMDNTVHFVTGQRGARKIYCDGFSYICAKSSKKRKYWVCAKQRSRNCKARLITDADETVFVRRNQQHIHPREKHNFQEKTNKSAFFAWTLFSFHLMWTIYRRDKNKNKLDISNKQLIATRCVFTFAFSKMYFF